MEHIGQFFPAICAGLGLFLAGALNLIFLRRGFVLRAAATAAGLGIALVAAAMLEPATTLGNTARLLAIVLIPAMLLGSGHLLLAVKSSLTALGRPAVRHGLLTVGGIGLAIGAVVEFERADNRILNENDAEFELVHAHVPSNPSTREKASSDRGTPIEISEPLAPRDPVLINDLEARHLADGMFREALIRGGPVDDRSNCHGWVFTGGRYLVRGSDVELILSDNNYCQENTPRPGDLVVYRSAAGSSITHTAVVQYVTDGEPVLVRSKWGSLGIFTHPVNKSPYGTEFTFHRSPRGGHLLVLSPFSSSELPQTPATD